MEGVIEMANPTKSLVRLIPVLGVALILGSFGWAIRAGFFDATAGAMAGIGSLLFLTIFIETEAANLRHYLSVGFYAALTLGICVILYMFASRYDGRLDLTKRKLHTLSDGTLRYLGLLKKDVEIVAFDTDDKPYRGLLQQYAAATPRVKWSAVDPRRDPVFSRKFDSAIPPQSVYIRHGETKKRISLAEFNEAAITNAIVEVTRQSRIVVNFLRGHGELEFDTPPKAQSQIASVGAFKNFLAGRAMEVDELNLVERGFVPKETTLVVFAGPTRDFLPTEAEQLYKYIEGGGKLLGFMDLPRETGLSVDFTNLTSMLRRLGLDDKEEIVVDVNGKRHHGHPLKVPIMWLNPNHPVTQPLAATSSNQIVLPLVRSLKPLEPSIKEYALTPLIASSEEAWALPFTTVGSTGIKSPAKLEAMPAGWAIETPPDDKTGRPKTRVAIFGTSELVNDGFITANNTAARLMLNTVNWLVEQEDLVYVPEKIVEGTPLLIGEAQLRLVLIMLTMAFPSLIFFGGITYVKLWRKG